MIKPLIKLGIEENFLKLIKNIYKKNHSGNIILNENHMFHPKIGNKAMYLLSPLLVNRVLEVLASVTRQEMEIKIIIQKNYNCHYLHLTEKIPRNRSTAPSPQKNPRANSLTKLH